MKLIFSKEAEEYLEKKSSKSNQRLNLVLHGREICKTCYNRMEPDISFETDENYLDGITKIEDWRGKIDIYMDPVIKSFLLNEDEIKISLTGKIFKRLIIENAKSFLNL